ncbi:MAG: GIY-YIG nuclease family protein [Rhodospirillales bacterium]|nr:GIY-YIG nuclease family protein [Rhodospirillales bacterium]MCB9995651.1 GIY-YIG nuclease family protein [Rhodospirillales bacterium]
MKKSFYVYILSSTHNRVLYIGVTSDLPKRVWEHKNRVIKGFTEKYNVDRLVYYEVYNDSESAIKRERNMKEWKRDWKVQLIEKENPEWQDLYKTICA